jgi:hypothetical protein
MDSKQAGREGFETLPQHDTAEQKHAVEIFKRRWKKRFERLLLHRNSNNKHLLLAHPLWLVALKFDAPYGSAFSRWESLANECLA